MKSLEEQIRELPPELRRQVEDYVAFLVARHGRQSRGRPSFGWAGALSDLKERYSSVDLQHEITSWRAESQ